MTHFFTHRLPLLSGSLTNLIIMFYTQMIDWLIIISFSNNKSEIEVLTAATDLLLGFASLNSRRKSSLWHRTLRNQLKTVKKRKKQWGKWEVLQEDEESAWRSLRFVWVLRRRLLLPSSCFQSEIKKKIEVSEVLQILDFWEKWRAEPLVGARRFSFRLAAFHLEFCEQE